MTFLDHTLTALTGALSGWSAARYIWPTKTDHSKCDVKYQILRAEFNGKLRAAYEKGQLSGMRSIPDMENQIDRITKQNDLNWDKFNRIVGAPEGNRGALAGSGLGQAAHSFAVEAEIQEFKND
jgi:hypothetical protein